MRPRCRPPSRVHERRKVYDEPRPGQRMRRVYARAGRAARLPTARPARRARSAAATAQGVHPSAATLATVKATVPTVTKSTCCSRIAASPGRPRRGLHRSQAEQPIQCRLRLPLPFGSVGTRTLARAKPTDRTMCRPKTTGPRQKLRGSSCTNWLGICVEWCRRSPRCGSDFAISMGLWWVDSELEYLRNLSGYSGLISHARFSLPFFGLRFFLGLRSFFGLCPAPERARSVARCLFTCSLDARFRCDCLRSARSRCALSTSVSVSCSRRSPSFCPRCRAVRNERSWPQPMD